MGSLDIRIGFVMQFGPTRPPLRWFWEPNSIIVVMYGPELLPILFGESPIMIYPKTL